MAKKVTKKKAPAKKTTTRKPQTTAKAKARVAVKAKSVAVAQITEDEIRVRAFEIYRSGRNKDPDADWMQAEQELRAEATT